MMRKPVVAGQFYTARENLLKKELEGFWGRKKQRFDAIGIVSPHAGYMYSGPVAGDVISTITPRPTYIILGPNHTGAGKPFGLDVSRTWKTPLGDVPTDGALGRALLEQCRYLEQDTSCHDSEHSIEVQLPFLQHLSREFSFVPIVVSCADRRIYKEIGSHIARVIRERKADCSIIASSDMTHYEPHEDAKKKDALAIEKIVALDIDGFLDTVQKHRISMCGVAPTAIMMQASVELGATKAALVTYATSGDTSGDYTAVVGYAGIVLY